MNENITKLIVQTDIYCDQHWLGNPFYEVKWEEKFAELIVQECAKLIRDKSSSIVKKAEIYAEPDVDEIDAAKATAWQFLVLEQQMKKHFGVE